MLAKGRCSKKGQRPFRFDNISAIIHPWLVTCEQFKGEAELTEEMAHELIERVEIDADNHVSVTLRFRDEYHALVHLWRRKLCCPIYMEVPSE